jgi:hypothetical protein
MSVLWQEQVRCISIRGNGCLAKVKTDSILLYARARALSLLSMEPKRTSKAAEKGYQKVGSGVSA